MEYIKLRNTDMIVSRLCMGGCPMGGYGWGYVNEGELISAINAALDNGVNFFDTADTYGLGQSECTLSKGLKGKRHKAIIATKFGVRIQNGKTFYDNSPDYINQALNASLKRLNTEYIDLYQVHYRDGLTPLEAIVQTLERAKSAGKIRAYGLSNINAEDIDEVRSFPNRFSTCQNEFSLACRIHEIKMRQIQTELNITPMSWGSLGQGILTGKYSSTSIFDENDRRNREAYVNFHGEKLMRNLKIVDVMRPIAQAHGVSIAAIALRFVLDHMKDSVVLAGVKRPEQLFSNLETMDWELSKLELEELARVSQ